MAERSILELVDGNGSKTIPQLKDRIPEKAKEVFKKLDDFYDESSYRSHVNWQEVKSLGFSV